MNDEQEKLLKELQDKYTLLDLKTCDGLILCLLSVYIDSKLKDEKVAELKERLSRITTLHFASQNESLRGEMKQGEWDINAEVKDVEKPEESTEESTDEPPKEEEKPKKSKGKRNFFTIEPSVTTEEEILPPEVEANPEAYRRLNEENPVTFTRTEYVPGYTKRTIVKVPGFVPKNDPFFPPIRAAIPKNLLRGSEVGNSLPALVAHNKFSLHLPLNRQIGLLERFGIKGIKLNTLCNWMRVVAKELKRLYEYLHAKLMQEAVLHVDETVFRCLLKKGKNTYIWVIKAVNGIAFYFYCPNRSASNLDVLLRKGMKASGESYSGTILTDGFGAYTSWLKMLLKAYEENPELPAPPRQQVCWTHARREFVEASKCSQDPKWCKVILRLMASLYTLEKELKKSKAPPEEILRRRQEEALPIVDEIFRKLKERLQDVPTPINKLKDAINYMLYREAELRLYLSDPAIPIDNNPVERAIRPVKLGLKNYTFAGSEEGAQAACIIYTMIEACKHAKVDSWAWLNAFLGKARDWKGDLEGLMPGNLALD